jgi:hypothetical protein
MEYIQGSITDLLVSSLALTVVSVIIMGWFASLAEGRRAGGMGWWHGTVPFLGSAATVLCGSGGYVCSLLAVGICVSFGTTMSAKITVRII